LASGVGTLISLRAATVRQAQQTFSFAFFALFIPMMLIPILPDEWKLRLAEWLAAAPDVNTILLLIGVILFFLNLALLGLALRRFQRAQLILD
jgi:ABC-2 type transport system permease protein